MKIPFSYSLRNLFTRRLTTFLTASGMALVVFVFAAVLMLAEGLQKTLVETGSYENVVVIRKAAGSEVQSGIDRVQASIVETQPEIATGTDGKPLVAKELVVLIALPKRGSDKPSNIVIRGIGGKSMALRPQVKLVAGQNAASRLVGDHFRIEHRETVSGWRDGREAPFRHEGLDGCRCL